MIHWIFTLALLQGAPSQKDEIGSWIDLPTAQLEALAKHAKGGDRGVIHLILASRDTSHASSLDLAHPVLDSLYQVRPTPMCAALLGTAEALEARRARPDVIAATKWVGRAMDHLQTAVRGDSLDPVLRIFRINSLVEVPEIFHVDALLKSDEAFLRHLQPRLAVADPSVMMALALVGYRFGNLTEASAIWKLVAARKDIPSTLRLDARRRLEALGG